VAAHVEALVGLERHEQARAAGESALALCRTLEIGIASLGIARALALAEAKLGAFDEAVARLEGVIQDQLALGVTGLHLGATYEARARVAIWRHDASGVEKFTRLTAREYRHGEGSPLGARYERLMHEAQRFGHDTAPLLDDPGTLPAWTAATQIDVSGLDLTTETVHEANRS
jgi:hypothetical protein